jgi:hypothetical protein
VKNRIREVQPTERAAIWIARNLKASDRAELDEYGLGLNPEQLFPEWSRLPGTTLFLVDGVPAAIGGVNEGSTAWFFSTDAISGVRLSAHRMAKYRVREWVLKYGPLHNWVSIKNASAIDWIYCIGGWFDPEVYQFSSEGGVFVKFWLK